MRPFRLATLSGDGKATLVEAVAAVRSLPEVAIRSRRLRAGP
jgi:hypothetical protein